MTTTGKAAVGIRFKMNLVKDGKHENNDHGDRAAHEHIDSVSDTETKILKNQSNVQPAIHIISFVQIFYKLLWRIEEC